MFLIRKGPSAPVVKVGNSAQLCGIPCRSCTIHPLGRAGASVICREQPNTIEFRGRSWYLPEGIAMRSTGSSVDFVSGRRVPPRVIVLITSRSLSKSSWVRRFRYGGMAARIAIKSRGICWHLSRAVSRQKAAAADQKQKPPFVGRRLLHFHVSCSP